MKKTLYGLTVVLSMATALRLPGAPQALFPLRPGRADSTGVNTAETTPEIRQSTPASEWLQAAEQGDIQACKALGACYGDPSDAVVVRNLRASLNWYLKAAEQGDTEAQRLAGEAWLQLSDDLEEPRPHEMAQACYWFRQAAERGDSIARRRLGELAVEYPAECSPQSAAPQPEKPVPEGRCKGYPAHPEEYARLLNAVDRAAAHGTRLMTPQDPKLGVVVNRSRFEALRDRLLSGADYNAPNYRAALDSLQAHHTIRTFDDMGMNYLLFKLMQCYDERQITWSAWRQTAPDRYETTDLETQSDYVVERSNDRWHVYRLPSGHARTADKP